MKKFCIVLLLSIVILFSAVAGGFEFNIGASGTCNKGYNELVEGQGKVEVGDFSFGLDTDVKLAFVDVQANALYSKVGDANVINGILSANLSLDVFFLRINAGVGYDYIYNITTGEYLIAGKDNFDNLIENPFYLRASVEVIFDSIHVGAFATYPTLVSIPEFFTNIQVVDWNAVLQGATFGLSAKISLF